MGISKKETKIKRILQDRGISLGQLSQKIEDENPGYLIGVDRLSRISRTGKGLNIHLQVIVKIAKALNCSIDELVDDMD